MSAIKKALRSSVRRRRYSMFDQKENDYINTPRSKRASENEMKNAAGVSVQSRRYSAIFLRGSKMTKSMREAVGTIKQKFKTSKRYMEPLKENQTSTPVRLSRRINGDDVSLYSPFCIETPSRSLRRSRIKTVASLETPTRLRREVEELTANMQALSALTPNTLQTRRKSATPLTNGSLKTPRSARRRLPSTPSNPA